MVLPPAALQKTLPSARTQDQLVDRVIEFDGILGSGSVVIHNQRRIKLKQYTLNLTDILRWARRFERNLRLLGVLGKPRQPPTLFVNSVGKY
jgi:hypothetical protein